MVTRSGMPGVPGNARGVPTLVPTSEIARVVAALASALNRDDALNVSPLTSGGGAWQVQVQRERAAERPAA
jgi:hypothetical protein